MKSTNVLKISEWLTDYKEMPIMIYGIEHQYKTATNIPVTVADDLYLRNLKHLYTTLKELLAGFDQLTRDVITLRYFESDKPVSLPTVANRYGIPVKYAGMICQEVFRRIELETGLV